MNTAHLPMATAFRGNALLKAGPLSQVALAIKKLESTAASTERLLTFDDLSGSVIDLDLRGNDVDIIQRLLLQWPDKGASAPLADAPSLAETVAGNEVRGRGRPKLGVVAREITLLPRHWEWLATQSGGASVTLRRLVDDARREGGGRQQRRHAQEAAYRFMSAMAGDLAHYEEACRALFADDAATFRQRIADWPTDVSRYAVQLAGFATPQ